jgi:predicted anti-sigma-YlaC factor YlaD
LNLASFREWVRQIYATQDDELDCDEVFQRIDKYVDLEIAGEDPAAYYPKVKDHLIQCPRCRDLQQGIRDAAQIEENETTSSISVEMQYQASSPPT